MSTKSSPHKRLKKRLKREIRREQCGRYALESSPLYGLSSIHRLASLLRISVDEFKEVAAYPTYRQTTETDESGKVRAIQEPLGLTLTLHYRFVRLLDRIKRPAFLHSATRERSHLSNARSHTGMHAMAATDIAKFYENTKTHHLKAFFHVQLGWAHDLAVMMTAALTFEGHLATGSACSPLLSYFAHFKLFERIEALCAQEQVKMTLFVDDLTISGPHATKRLLYQIKGEFKRAGLPSHKDRFAPKGRPMVVTGAMPSVDRLQLRNKHRKSLHELISGIATGEPVDVRVVEGKLASAVQTDPVGAAPLVAAYKSNKAQLSTAKPPDTDRTA
jgi:hypothetical protein